MTNNEKLIINEVTAIHQRIARECETFQQLGNTTSTKFKELSWLLAKRAFISIFKKNYKLQEIEQKIKSCRYNCGVLSGCLERAMDLMNELQKVLEDAGEYEKYKDDVDYSKQMLVSDLKNIEQMEEKLKL